MEVQEIESAIQQLSSEQLTKLSEWFEEYLAEEVDRKLEDAIDRGFFDEMARQADAERQAGRCAPL